MWLAGWNQPGCLPETDPVSFDDWERARNYIVDELNRWADQEDCEQDDSVPTETFMRAINSVRDLESGESNDNNWSSWHHIAGYVFWIERFS